MSKPLFATFEQRALDGYLRGGLRAATAGGRAAGGRAAGGGAAGGGATSGGAVELCCDRSFEADIYKLDLSGSWARLP